MKKPLTVTKDFTKEFNQITKSLKRDQVLVGIPEDRDNRKEGEFGNAAILALNHFGSEVNQIPAWPVLTLGIEKARDEIAEHFKKGAVDVLSQGHRGLKTAYDRAGSTGSVAVKKLINAQEDAPELADSTLKAREAKGFKGTKRLIVTGQLRNAITWVIKGKGE